jgi:hypothetical protein
VVEQVDGAYGFDEQGALVLVQLLAVNDAVPQTPAGVRRPAGRPGVAHGSATGTEVARFSGRNQSRHGGRPDVPRLID